MRWTRKEVVVTRHFVGILVLMVLVVGAGSAIGGPGAPSSPDEYSVLDRLAAAAKPVMLTFNETPLAQVFEAVRQASGVDVELKSVPARMVTIRTGKVSLKDALVQLARDNDLAYEVSGEDKLVVHSKAKAAS